MKNRLNVSKWVDRVEKILVQTDHKKIDAAEITNQNELIELLRTSLHLIQGFESSTEDMLKRHFAQ